MIERAAVFFYRENLSEYQLCLYRFQCQQPSVMQILLLCKKRTACLNQTDSILVPFMVLTLLFPRMDRRQSPQASGGFHIFFPRIILHRRHGKNRLHPQIRSYGQSLFACVQFFSVDCSANSRFRNISHFSGSSNHDFRTSSFWFRPIFRTASLAASS